MRRREQIVVAIILGAALVLYGYGWYVGRPDRQVDLYPAWAATRELLAHGTNPYSDEALRAIQRGEMGSHSYWAHLYDVGFVYPVPLLVVLLPLAFLPLKLASTVWIVLAQVMSVASVFLLASPCRQHLGRRRALLLVFLGAFLFEPNFETAFWGQFAAIGLFSAALVYWALVNDQSILAGAALALGMVRPQAIPLLTAWLLIWALWGRRWRFLAGFGAACAALLLASEWLVSGWIWAFWQTVPRYQSVTTALPPIGYLLQGGSIWVGTAVLVLLLGIVCWQRRATMPGSGRFDQAYELSLIAGILLFPQTSTYALTPLMIPMLLCWWRGHDRLTRTLAVTGLFVLPWGVQAARAILGSAGEADWHLVPLPLYSLLIWATAMWRGRTLSLTVLREAR